MESNWRFTWDDRKDRANQKKHHISFEGASHVFDDPFLLSAQDREVDGETRWQTIGMVGTHVLMVAHTIDEEAGVIRVISARKATRRERSIYAQGI